MRKLQRATSFATGLFWVAETIETKNLRAETLGCVFHAKLAERLDKTAINP